MKNTPLDERSFELINIVGAKLATNQRDISRHLNWSLGLTNTLLKRLVTKGYIRIKQLNKKKVEYILTPKGFSEKLSKSVKYTMKTINSITLVQQRIRQLFEYLKAQGHQQIFLYGDSGLVALVELSFKEIMPATAQLVRIMDNHQLLRQEGLLLICQEKLPEGIANKNYIHLIELLAKDSEMIDGYINSTTT